MDEHQGPAAGGAESAMVKAEAECAEAASVEMGGDESQRIAAMFQTGGLPGSELVDSSDAERDSAGEGQSAADIG